MGDRLEDARVNVMLNNVHEGTWYAYEFRCSDWSPVMRFCENGPELSGFISVLLLAKYVSISGGKWSFKCIFKRFLKLYSNNLT